MKSQKTCPSFASPKETSRSQDFYPPCNFYLPSFEFQYPMDSPNPVRSPYTPVEDPIYNWDFFTAKGEDQGTPNGQNSDSENTYVSRDGSSGSEKYIFTGAGNLTETTKCGDFDGGDISGTMRTGSIGSENISETIRNLVFGSGNATETMRIGNMGMGLPPQCAAPILNDFGMRSCSKGGRKGRRFGVGSVEAAEKRHRRMIKNRESAARSRARKQAYDTQLEIEVNELKKENEVLRKKRKIMKALDDDETAPPPKEEPSRTSSAAF